MNSQRSKVACRGPRHGERRLKSDSPRPALLGERAPLKLVTLQQSKQMWPSFIKDVQNNYPDLKLPRFYIINNKTNFSSICE